MHRRKQFTFVLEIDVADVENRYNISTNNALDTQPTHATTGVSELSLEYSTPDADVAYSYMDESKREHTCVVTMVNHLSRERTSEHTSTHCFWDHAPFDTTPVGCPVRYVASQVVRTYASDGVKDKMVIRENINHRSEDEDSVVNGYYEVDGVFCSLQCCLAFINDPANTRNPLYVNSASLLRRMARDLFGGSVGVILPADHWRTLAVYDGHQSIERFRAFSKTKNYTETGMVIRDTSVLKRLRPMGHVFEENIGFR